MNLRDRWWSATVVHSDPREFHAILL